MLPMLPMLVPEILRIERTDDQGRDDEANFRKFVCKCRESGGNG